MKKEFRYFLMVIPLTTLVFMLFDYNKVLKDPRNSDFTWAMPASVKEDTQQQCIVYAQSLGYEPGAYLGAAVIGQSRLSLVCGDTPYRDLLLDKNDIVVFFEDFRCVVDKNLPYIFGYIPYS